MEFIEPIIQYFTAQELDWPYYLKIGGVLLLGCLLISLFAKFIFGKKSAVSSSVSSAISIIFICAIIVVLRSFGVQSNAAPPLPFVILQNDALLLFDFFSADYTVICAQVLSMVILAFFINLIDGLLPKKKNVFAWLFFRCLTVAIAYGVHLLLTWSFTTYLPAWITTYAPVVLLALLVLLLLTGALKILVGAAMATVNPIIAALYTFFFAKMIGRQLSKALLTTTLLVCFLILLRYLGVTIISITSAALVAYIPFLVLLLSLWYIVHRVM